MWLVSWGVGGGKLLHVADVNQQPHGLGAEAGRAVVQSLAAAAAAAVAVNLLVIARLTDGLPD